MCISILIVYDIYRDLGSFHEKNILDMEIKKARLVSSFTGEHKSRFVISQILIVTAILYELEFELTNTDNSPLYSPTFTKLCIYTHMSQCPGEL